VLKLNEFFSRSIGDSSLTRPLAHCAPSASVEQVIKQLQTSNSGSVAVVENKKVLGIFTERDLLKKIALASLDLKTTKVSAVMTANPVSVRRQTKLSEAINKMRTGKFRHLIVEDAYGVAEGILSMRDIMDYLCNALMQDTKIAA
jgi:signal-transduction protein with cAMP-binding, CBS, and nucleotidyltransferase domain